jgi:hypothetical protein
MNKAYEIWHVQDFDDIGDMLYKKITGIPEETLEQTQKLADKYIDHIEILINVHGQKFMLGTYYDKLFIIKTGDDIKTYNGDEYYDMRDLRERIKRQNKEKLLMNRYKTSRLVIGYLSLILLIFYVTSSYAVKNEDILQPMGVFKELRNPVISFKKIYKRHTNFALEPSNNKKLNFGQTFTFSPLDDFCNSEFEKYNAKFCLKYHPNNWNCIINNCISLSRTIPHYIKIVLPPIYHSNETTKQCLLLL